MIFVKKSIYFSFFIIIFTTLNSQITYFENSSLYFDNIKYNGYMRLFPDIIAEQVSTNKWLIRKLTEENLVMLTDSIAKIIINPFLDLSIGIDKTNNTKINFVNTRGVYMMAQIGKKLYLSSEFYENQAYLPRYYMSLIDSIGFLPGNNWVKKYRNRGLDYGLALGRIQWQATNWFAIESGFNTLNVGHGYRSLILGYDARPYPYIHFVFNYQKKIILGNITGIAYHNDNVVDITEISTRNIFSVNYFTFNPYDFLSISLLDFTIFHPAKKQLRFSPYTFILIPQLRPFILQNKPSWSLPGYAINFYLPNNDIYFQNTINIDDAIDKNFKNKLAYQIGILSRIKFKDTSLFFNVRLEYNNVAEHAMDNEYYSTYPTHLSQPLGMWQGENLKEIILQLNILKNRHLFQLFSSYQNIKISPFNLNNYLGQINNIYTSITYTYLINPVAGLGVFAELQFRIPFVNDFYINNALGD